jgi:hypothetical protein
LPQPLIVLNNLSLAGNAVLNTTIPATDVNVTVGNDFTPCRNKPVYSRSKYNHL